MKSAPASPRTEVLVVGSSNRFISGISHHTRYVAEALWERTPTSVILMRRLIPAALYPGRDRVGAQLSDAEYPAEMPRFDGVDWYWLPSILQALLFMRRRRPRALVMQWWTGAVLHSYIVLAIAARLMGSRILIELHEIQDSGEASIAPLRWYVQRFGRWLIASADGFIVHSEFDRAAVQAALPVAGRPIRVARVGPYTHYAVDTSEPLREAPPGACNILYFGTIRPYKGLEELVGAFDALAQDEPDWWLTVVGETWEGWTGPIEMIEASPHRDRITLVNHYVTDTDASRWFAGADLIALPYRRSSASGPLHMTMEAGLPVVVTQVGGLTEAAQGYGGAVMVPPQDVAALSDGLREAKTLRGRRVIDEGSWGGIADAALQILDELDAAR